MTTKSRAEYIQRIKTALDARAFDTAGRLAREARAAGVVDVADRADAAIRRLVAERPAPVIGGRKPARLLEGLYTVTDAEGHVTFRVQKQAEDAKFAPGETVIERLVGRDNESDYRGVAFWKPDGRVVVWKKYRGDARLEAAIRVLVGDPKAAAMAYAQASGRCWRCGRVLTTPESIVAGIGPVCASSGY